MADLVSYRDTEQALIALKKGTHLLKYGRKGKPKFCPFRISTDESSLIWISSSGEKSLKLTSVSRIISGQRTAVFKRYLRPEKDYLSFSLIYNNGKRTLDLICKDKVEAEAWIAGLKVLISSGEGGRSKIDGWRDGGLYFEDNQELTSNGQSDSSNATLEISSTELSVRSSTNSSSSKSHQTENSMQVERLLVAWDQANNMQPPKLTPNSDAFRVSVSSAAHSTSSHGSAPDDDALGDIYIWGEVISINNNNNNNTNNVKKVDVLLPRPLESNIVLDVNSVACGVKHAALVTRQGEVFTWGEESGGRLGHGVGKDVSHPRLVESLSFSSVDFVACGEFHTCAVTLSGELYTWGDGTHNAGLLGHGSDLSHWIPKRISGPLEGLHIAIVACGPWHTALVTSAGQLFTFGDGTFGVLGHGERESVSSPREVASLSGLRTIAVACGVWHTAAVIGVIVTSSSSSVSSGKLFTWGDGDKNRLGHGDKEPRLEPTCVSALIEYDFNKIACGHSLTVGLTTSGQVFTMGSTVYGQLGNPDCDGKSPCLVQDKLKGENVEEIACGAYHVAVLTTKNEVFTWGKGANGRLGHGDIEDKKTPTLVEALKDRHVKYIACGSNYSAAICLHKWVSGAEQSQCSACRLAFGFTRKRHNCYNCGLVHCHSCSSRKAVRAALSPNPNKPYRVCDTCFSKLSKVAEADANGRRNATPRVSGENKDILRSSKLSLPSNLDIIKQLDNKAAKQGRKGGDSLSLGRPSQVKDSGFDLRRSVPKPVATQSVVNSRSVSPFSRKSSPPRSVTPVPTTAGLSFSKGVTDGLRKTNELLNNEAQRLRTQVESLRQRCELQEAELQKSAKKAQEAMELAAEESAKSKAAKEVIKSLTAQLKDMAEKLPPGTYDANNMRAVYLPNGLESNGINPHSNTNGSRHSDSMESSRFSSSGIESTTLSLAQSPDTVLRNQTQNFSSPNGPENREPRVPNGGGEGANRADAASESLPENNCDLSTRNSNSGVAGNNNNNQVEAEWIEQYEPGVYLTLMALKDGTRDLKRVRFSRRRFGEHQAETWWSENRERVYEKYNVRGSDKSSVSSQTARRSEGGFSPSSQF